jgi:hypothetical protein
VPAANLKWLAGYRHPRHPRNAGRPGLMAVVLESFTAPRALIDGAEAVGDPIEVLPVVFHALWNRSLDVSLEAPLHERVLVGPGAPSDAGRDGADHSAGAPGGTGSRDAAGAAGTDGIGTPGPTGKDPGDPGGAMARGQAGHRPQEAR